MNPHSLIKNARVSHTVLETKYLTIWLIRKTEKTQTWQIDDKLRRPLGQIKWCRGWRSYAFYPDEGTFWDEECLGEINNFLKALKEIRGSK